MKFRTGQRIYFRSLTSERTYRGHIVRELTGGFYLVDDGTSRPPRVVHGNRLGTPEIRTTQVFA